MRNAQTLVVLKNAVQAHHCPVMNQKPLTSIYTAQMKREFRTNIALLLRLGDSLVVRQLTVLGYVGRNHHRHRWRSPCRGFMLRWTPVLTVPQAGDHSIVDLRFTGRSDRCAIRGDHVLQGEVARRCTSAFGSGRCGRHQLRHGIVFVELFWRTAVGSRYVLQRVHTFDRAHILREKGETKRNESDDIDNRFSCSGYCNDLYRSNATMAKIALTFIFDSLRESSSSMGVVGVGMSSLTNCIS